MLILPASPRGRGRWRRARLRRAPAVAGGNHGGGVRFWERNGSGRPLSAALRRGLRDRSEVADLGRRSWTAGGWSAVLCSHRGASGSTMASRP